MKKIILIFFLLLVCWISNIYGQQIINVTGTIVDEQNVSLIGVNITVKDQPGFGTISDVNGHYKIKAPIYSTLIFSYVGYEKQEILLKGQKVINIKMNEGKENVLNEVVITGLGAQKKITVTGAVTTVNVDELKTPTANLANSLAGSVSGIIARQVSGQPGHNVSEFWIRGISTFGAGSSALVLVDGFERNLNEVNVEDIASFTVLKDASATAIYGSRGANGVILITTKHGKEGKVHINGKAELSYSQRTLTPKLVGGVTYAKMLNEALEARNQEAAYSESDIDLIKSGLDSDLFPNVNWMGLLLKNGAPTYRANIDISGGGSLARYFLSGSYIDEGGMYKVDKSMKKDYDTNANYRRWNYRMNVDVNITKTTLLSLGVSGSLDKQNEPGGSYDEIWESLLGQNPISIPVKYSNGYVGSRGASGRNNPWVLITQQGYTETWKNKIQTTTNLKQDLSFITKGLKFFGRFGYDTNDYNDNRRMKWPAGWQAERMRDSDGNLVFKKVLDEHLMSVVPHSYGERKENLEAELHYDRTFEDHKVGGIFKYLVDKTVDTSENPDADYIKSIDRRHQGIAGRFTYGYKMRYFFDFNFGYTGSENFAKHHRYGFFPASSVAWNVAEEPFIAKHLKWMNMFKVRYSYGKVGNDNTGDITRFPYHSSFKTGDIYGYNYGDVGNSYSYQGLTYASVASNDVTWEVAKKHDLGVDFSLFNNQLSGTVDYFSEHRDGIYMSRSYLPAIVGLNTLSSFPAANVGSVSSEGFDGNISLKQEIGNVNVTIRGNMTYSKNKILEYDEEYSRYDYKLYKGFRVNQARGLIAEGLFKDYDDIRNHSKQTFGDVAPGDIKYKDVNGDGVINNDDIVPIGSTTTPNLIYGFGASALWKGVDFNVHFQGAGKTSFFANGYIVRPFNYNDWGNFVTDVIGNYWSLGKNEDTNAKYPRLTYGNSGNNYRNSTYWMRDGSYLRLKTLEIGYTIPKRLLIHLHVTKLRFYFIGTNLLTFSKFKLWDPELASSTGKEYPLSRVYTLGFTINL